MAVTLTFSLTSVSQASLWTGAGADDEFSTTANWDDGGINGTQDINGAFIVERSVDNTAQRTFVAGGAVLNVTGGTHNDNRSGNTIRNFLGWGSEGTVNQSGGSYGIGHILLVGGNNASGDGTYNLTNGDLSVYRGGNSFMGIAGGSSVEIGTGGGAGLFQISGGSFETRVGVGVGGTGVFDVVGSGASSIGIGSNGSLDGSWNQAAGGVLRSGVDASGITPILIDVTTGTGVGGGNAIFAAGSILDPYDAGGAVPNIWNTVMTWEGALTDNGLSLSTDALAAGWEHQISGSSLQVRLVAIPEPGAFLMLSAVALAVKLRTGSRRHSS